jgi:hypothetical protein
MSRFQCRICKRNSRFYNSRRKIKFVMEFKRFDVSSLSESRTYACEHCEGENEITHDDWAGVSHVD